MARCLPWRASRRITRCLPIASARCSTVKYRQDAAPLTPVFGSKFPPQGSTPIRTAASFAVTYKYSGDQQDVVVNPVLLVEVLSPSTEGYDRGKKFELYRTIESFREYLIVHQDRQHVEHYSKQDDVSWLLREHAGDAVAIARLNVQILLADLYASALGL